MAESAEQDNGGSAPSSANPHQGQRIAVAGVPPDQAQAAMILVHGRGSSAADILSLASELDQPGFTYLAPQASNNTWYPYRFLAPVADNEPWLSSALQAIDELLVRVAKGGIPAERTVLLGFSQGACLVLEYAARHARRYGGIIGLSGGLIGPAVDPRAYSGALDGTPVFLGCSDADLHIPAQRVRESARVFQALAGDVTLRLYPQMGHTINQDELDFIAGLMAELAARS